MGNLILLGCLGLVCALILNKFVLPILIRIKAGQTVREDGPQTHLQKNGTPTMGGFIFIISTVVVSVVAMLFIKTTNDFWIKDKWLFILPIISMCCFGLVGFLDDYIKVVKKQSLGLNAKQKIVLQFIFAFIISYISQNIVGMGSIIIVPFYGSVDLGIFYIPFSMFVIIALVNSVNLTDGLDGLATSVTILVSLVFIRLARNAYESLQAFLAILIGSCLGFLNLNKYPAKVFMGDTGSMALGGAIAGVVTLLRIELIVPIVCFVYFMESVSVIMQVLYFKKTGKRIFKMAPLHHHFEQLGWHETKVVTVFCLITIVMGILGIVLI